MVRVDPWHFVEGFAVLGNLAYTVLMMLGKRAGWLFGIAASVLGAALFWKGNAYPHAGLNVFYAGMGVYGWWQWGHANGKELPITRRGLPFHLSMLLFGGGLAVLLAFGAGHLPGARFTGLDGAVTAFSVLATWMLARKLLENWAYWIVTDLAAIVLYLLMGLHGYAGLYTVYVVLSVTALVRWTREWRRTMG